MYESKAMKAAKEKARQEVLTELHKMLKPGDTVMTVLRHVSSSGMSRNISLFAMVKNHKGETHLRNLDWLAAQALDMKLAENTAGIRTGGVGMDMGFKLVYDLASTMWPEGFGCIGEGCPSNDHVNRENRSHHRDGGYALEHQWL